MKVLQMLSLLISVYCIVWAAQNSEVLVQLSTLQDPGSEHPKYHIVFRENDNVIADRIFQNGKLISKKGTIPGNAVNAVTLRLSAENGKTNPIAIYFHNGKQISGDQIPDGFVIEYYDNGNIKNIFKYLNHTRNGLAFGFYENGNVKAEAYYKDSLPTGRGRRYYENGNLMADWNIENNRETSHREYYENGNLKEQIIFEGGKTKKSVYDLRGNVIEESDYGLESR
jgi:antitoxin component YwqK of YwqJK toxin-antitoxin module